MADRMSCIPWVLSGETEDELRARARSLVRHLDARPEVPIRDVGLTLATTGAASPRRAVVVGDAREPLTDALRALSEGRPAPGLVRGTADLAPTAGTVFVFPGQGSQWTGMAAELLAASTVFAESMASCEAALAPYVDWSLLEVARGEPDGPDPGRADVVQPVLWAVMVSLAAVWRSLGVEPAAVVGHSYGEVAAACVAGGLSLEDGARVVALAGNLVAEALSGEGGMVLVGLALNVVREWLASSADRLWIGAVNGPASVVVSGPDDALAEMTAHWSGRARLGRIDVDYASHSPLVERIEHRLAPLLAPVRPRSSRIPFYSAVTGGPLDTAALDGGYWYRNLRRTVEFHGATNQLVEDGFTAFVEVSPHPVLVESVRDSARAAGGTSAAVGTLRRGDAGMSRLLTAMAELYVRGVHVDWEPFLGADASHVELPPEPSGRSDDLHDLVRDECAAVLGYREPGRIAVDLPFTELGLDSATLMELVARLGTATGLAVTSNMVFDHPTPAKLADYLGSLTDDRAAVARPAPAPAGGRTYEPIVITGMACRYPGGADSPELLWNLVRDGVDAISAVPTDRGWGEEFLSTAPGGGFLYEAGEFDAAFFGISPREALAMDPQQRLSLEVAWEALERAGIDPTSLHGGQAGVFLGAMAQDYGPRLHETSSDGEGYTFTGTSPSVLSGRVSYVLGLQGPAVTVDTACSSSLVAVHLGVQALRSGECELVLAGGATVMASPGILMEFTKLGGLSPDGRCRAFAAAADGTGFSEGVGMLVMERLSDARRHGRRVLAVVRGSAINQDGASNGLAAPNGLSQQRVIRRALSDAGLSPADVDAVETHGTGTVLGDPIEAQALLATYGQDRDRPVLVGSVKSNIGHTQAAAGVTGVIKMVLALRHGVLPPTLHVDRPSPKVDWSAGAAELLVQRREWPDSGRPRRAGVSAFGVSGTNAHLILEQAPDDPVQTPEQAPAVVPVVVSARTASALSAHAGRVAAHLDPAVGLGDAARSLLTSRAVWEHRAVVVARDRDHAVDALRGVAEGRPVPAVVTGVAPRAGTAGKTVMVFPGQGAQWAGMGRELRDTAPVFAARMRDCERALQPHVSWSLSEVIGGTGDAAAWERVDVVQPASFAVMVSLAALWRSCGVRPDAVLGHSQGEIAAACVAGALSLDDAARVVALRSRAIAARLAGRGRMLSVALPEAQVRERIRACDGRVEVAAVNGPASVVVAGDPDALAVLEAECEAHGVRARPVPVDYASHTAEVEILRDELIELGRSTRPRNPALPWYSTADGDWVSGPVDAEYWYRNLRRPVGFEPATRALVQQGFRVFVEASPHPVLTSSVQDTLDDAEVGGVVCGTLRRDQGGLSRFVQSLAEGFVRGVEVDWTPLVPAAGAPAALPTYPFQRQRFWLTTSAAEPAKAPADSDTSDARFWKAVELGDATALASEIGVDADQPWSSVVPALSRWRRARRDRAEVDSWRYRVAWRPATGLTAGQEGTLPGRWLLITPTTEPADDAARTVGRAMAEHGAQVVTLSLDVAAHDPAALAERLRAVAAEGAPAGVVSLLALDRRPHPEHPVVPTGMAATLELVRALGHTGIEAPLWALTRGAVSTSRSDRLDDPDQALVWGMGRAAALEHPDRWGGLIDLPAALDDLVTSRLCRVLAGHQGEDQVAVRPQGVFVRRMVRAPSADRESAPTWRPRGTVLVTGGTGALGAHVARWLASRGAEHLLLASRRGPDAPGARRLCAELTGLGVAVRVAACDVADRAAVADLLASAQPPVTAVVHTAGVGRFSDIADTEVSDLAEVINAKAAGAAHLDELLDRPLDAFVVFSSGASTWGGGGQGGYAAANAFLDALVERRRADGKAGTSVAWGLWAGGGMGDGEVGERLARRGLLAMPPELALTAMGQALDHDEPTMTVADIDWPRFVPSFTWARPSPLLDELPEAKPEATVAPEPTESTLADSLATLDTTERLAALTDLVRAEAAVVLGHSSSEQIPEAGAFRDAGFDSLTSVELRNRLATATGLRLAATLVYDNETPTALAHHLLSAMDLGAGTQRPERSESLGEIYTRLAMRGHIEEMELVAAGVAALRDRADSDARVLRLARGDQAPHLICFPSFVALPGQMQYDRLSTAFGEVSDLSVVLLPGYQPDEPLAPSIEALTDLLARAALGCAEGEPFVLLGHSAGGLLAHAVATHLEAGGAPPLSVVLLDPFLPATMSAPLNKALFYEIFTRRAALAGEPDHTGITAMMTYLRMFREWRPSPLAAPTLVVRPTEGIRGAPEEPVSGLEWRTDWPLEHVETEAPGDHFAMSVEHAHTTVEIVRDWLSDLAVAAP